MNRVIKRFNILIFLSMMLISCQEEEPTLDTILVPTNLVISAIVEGDQSGNISVTPSADNALNFHVIFTPGADPVVINAGQTTVFRFTRSGQYSAPITLVAFGNGGVSSSVTEMIDLDVRLFLDDATKQLIAGDGTKRWVWDSTVAGHFGVGPLTNNFPEFFSAGPNSLNPCVYDDVLVFSYDDQDNYTYQLEPGADNLSFINWTDVNLFFPNATPQQFVDECRDITSQADFTSAFVVLDNADGSRVLDVGTSFLSYWAVIPGQYEIIELAENRLAVRGTSAPFNGDGPLYWYSVFVPEDLVSEEESVFDTLVWSDEFDVDGAPNTANWGYDLGAGGWGNNELQTYTNDAENVIVEGGFLKISAKDDGANGYTSARLKSENLQEFTFGRVEIRAKLPVGQGTWPALWMLGANFDTVGWPSCGEIDVMEQTGQDKSRTSAAIHFPGNSAGNAPTNDTENTAATTEFHNYILEWTSDEIKISVDDEAFFTFQNTDTIPFNSDFFFIMNIAMGGTLGGAIDPAFLESTMEVDYIRMYQ
ncbi:glycoside hydrolase family 16 protein [Maribacter antarcticus]|uniref:glycoside hydrolase family 16 protein n=1 Tax=Maribacter antarcticus TaxID=505250 RepID=UPI00055B5D0A|nr:glycoside hydrolase family 16 protein [Maribacter antarcticus]